MEHPIPQNITSFEFHLVGDMTLKQFAYLAAGVITAYLSFVFLMRVSPYVAIPVIVISASLGAAFAFLPILDRPLDHWVGAFFKAAYSPTQGKWLLSQNPKAVIKPEDPVTKNRLQLYLTSMGEIPAQASTPALTRLTPAQPSSVATPTPPPAPQQSLPSSEELTNVVETAKQAQMLQAKIAQAEAELEQLKAVAIPQGDHPASPQDIKQVIDNLQGVIKQTAGLREQAHQILPQAPMVIPAPIVIVEPPKQVRTQIQLTTFPNVVNGIITDTTGAYLEGVIVIIHDKDSLPVRALKTNKLGQFTGATPLPNGTYTITSEKDALEFDTLQLTLNGSVLPPLVINAKKGGLANG